MKHLRARMIGAITGAAVGDALGGAVEGYSPEQIAQDKQRRAEEQIALAFALQDKPQPQLTDEAATPGTGGTRQT